MPDEPEAIGLLALMLLHDSRRAARVDGEGRLVLLADQDRSAWDREEISEGLTLVERALALRGRGRYVVQAAIAAGHARARRAEDTDWTAIARAYDDLVALDDSPVVALNRAVAVAMAERAGGRAGAGRRAGRGARRLPPAARHPRRPAAAARPDGRGGRRVRARDRAGRQPRRARVPRAAARRGGAVKAAAGGGVKAAGAT